MAWLTTTHLERFANGFAEKVTELFAKKTDIPKSLPANGGDAETVNGHTVEANVPQGAKFTDTTYSAMTAATASAAGKSGLVPAPAAGKQAAFLRGDGTWAVPTNTTYSAMTAATASAAGKSGLVPAPAAGKQAAFLRGDGTWAEMAEATNAEIDAIIAGTFS
ncbi:MAG: hypothetical protein J6C19_05635 [Lachnospiraceae bacterium]|nr:hypothetical protein [Lachnospiraceae bacterium]